MGDFCPDKWGSMVIKPYLLDSNKYTGLSESGWKGYITKPVLLGSNMIVYAVIIGGRGVWVLNHLEDESICEERIYTSELEKLYIFSKEESITNQFLSKLI